MGTPSTTNDDRDPVIELIAQGLYAMDTGRAGQEVITDWSGRLVEDDRVHYRAMADTAIHIMRIAQKTAATLPLTAEALGDEVLTREQVERIAWAYDPTGTLYADITRLAASHENLRDTYNRMVAEFDPADDVAVDLAGFLRAATMTPEFRNLPGDDREALLGTLRRLDG